jgi:hypothetical protein
MSMSIHGSTDAACAAHATSEVTQRHRHHEARRHDDDGVSESRRPQLRHALADAISDAFAELTPAGQTPAAGADAASKEATVDRRAQAEALHDFRHELFAALRPAEGEGPGRHGRGFAWGRTSLADLADRIDALAQKIGGSPAPAPTSPPETATPSAETATPPAATTPTPDATAPDAQAPAVPSASASTDSDATSALLSAFQALTAKPGDSTSGAEGSGSAAESLAALLHRIAQALRGDDAATTPAAGSLVDTTA